MGEAQKDIRAHVKTTVTDNHRQAVVVIDKQTETGGAPAVQFAIGTLNPAGSWKFVRQSVPAAHPRKQGQYTRPDQAKHHHKSGTGQDDIE